MDEPDGLIERLRDGRSTERDMEYVEYRLTITTDHTESKLLGNLRARMIAAQNRMPFVRDSRPREQVQPGQAAPIDSEVPADR